MRVVVEPLLASSRISVIIQMDSRLLLNEGPRESPVATGISRYKMSVRAYS